MPHKQHQHALSALPWLSDQHAARYSERVTLVSSLGLRPGQNVLDAGCGPGFWTRLLAERVSPGGKVTGIDADPTLLVKARRTHAMAEDVALTFLESDLEALPFDEPTFDLSFCSNCLAYVPDPHLAVSELLRVTRTGGLVVGKCWDAAATVFHPVPMTLATRVLSGLAQALESAPLDPYFDNYFGRKMHGLFLSANLNNVTTATIASQIEGPLSPPAERWLRMKGKWIGETAQDHIVESDYAAWSALFDENDDRYILRDSDFYFCTIEVVSRGLVLR